MSPGAIALVLASAALHAAWNFLLKRAGGTQQVVALSKVAEGVLLAPLFLIGFAHALPSAPTTLLLTAIAALGVGANYITLAHAYRHGDLSVVYPIARGAILVFLPLAGWVALGERLSLLGVLGLASIIAGILTLNLADFTHQSLLGAARSLSGRATAYALASGFVAAVFTAWDKKAIALMHPFAYMYLYTLFVAIGYALWLRTRVAPEEVRASWLASWPSIVAIGLMNMGSYLLALFALRTGITSHVLGVRQVSIALGVAMGWRFLKEPLTPPRIVGVGFILAGCLTLSLASTLQR